MRLFWRVVFAVMAIAQVCQGHYTYAFIILHFLYLMGIQYAIEDVEKAIKDK